MAHFDGWNVQQALDKVKPLKWAKTNRLFYNGDHWQGGAGWPSPRLPAPNYSLAEIALHLASVQEVFVSENIIDEVIDRHVAGVIGREPDISVTLLRELAEGEEPTAVEERAIKAAETAVNEFLTGSWGIVTDEDSQLALDTPYKALGQSLINLLLSNRSGLRTRIIEQNKQLWAYFQAVEDAQLIIYTDPETLETAGIFTYTVDNEQRAEISYLDKSGNTVLKILDSEGQREKPVAYDLGGRLLHYQLTRKPFITSSVRQLQIALNRALTTSNKNLDYAFRERILINVQPPGNWQTNSETGESEFVASGSLVGGPGHVVHATGLPVFDEETGAVKAYTSGSVHYADPTPPTVYIASKEMYYTSLLQEVDQLHVLISGDATASGVSRQQARGDFKSSLLLTKTAVDNALEWMLHVRLNLLGIDTSKLRITADSQLDTGIILPSEREQNNRDYEAGTLSRESAIRANGVVSDPVGEIAQIEGEAETSLERLKDRAEIVGVLVNSGAGLPAATAVARFTDEQQQELSRMDFPIGEEGR